MDGPGVRWRLSRGEEQLLATVPGPPTFGQVAKSLVPAVPPPWLLLWNCKRSLHWTACKSYHVVCSQRIISIDLNLKLCVSKNDGLRAVNV